MIFFMCFTIIFSNEILINNFCVFKNLQLTIIYNYFNIMLFKLISLTITLIFILFVFLSIRMLIIFTKNFKKNKILNKSVFKNVFSGKLSLTIVLIFYGVSFSLIGGINLTFFSSKRGLEEQIITNNVYQSNVNNGFYNFTDPILTNYIEYHNSTSDDSEKILENKMVSPWFIDHTISDKTMANFSDYPKLVLENGELINPTDIFIDPRIFGDGEDYIVNNDSFGWTEDEWNEAFEWQVDDFLSLSPLNDKLNLNGSTLSDVLISEFFDDEILDFANFLLTYETLNGINFFQANYANDHVYNQNNSSFSEKISDWNKHLSFRAMDYVNFTPKNINNGESNVSFEIVLINDINWITGEKITSEDIKNGYGLNKYSDKDMMVNNTTFEEKSYEEFINSEQENKNTYNVIVQSDYLKEKKLSIGDDIPYTFINNDLENLKLNIYDSVKFNEITYPTMGLNILPDKEQQTFIGMKTSDFLEFSQKIDLNSVYKEKMNFLISTNGIVDLNKIENWMPGSDEFNEIVDWFNNYIIFLQTNWSGIYKISENDFAEILYEFNQEDINIRDLNYFLVEDQYLLEENGEKYFISPLIPNDSLNYVNDLDTIQSFRTITGVIEINSMKLIMKVLAIIFLTVIMIVISLLIIKRANSSSKQLGTLKAMGMKSNTIASAYLIFPMTIIFIGFIIAALISPIVMIVLNNIMGTFYYIDFAANSLSFGYFFWLFLMPLIFTVSLSYIIVLFVLRRPTLDLLNNKTIDAPNIFVRGFGNIVPKQTPFSVSYMSKGFLRAIGKSSLLFISILIATILISFSLSSTTMVKQQTESALSYLNFNSGSVNYNYGEYDVKKLYTENLDFNSDEKYTYEVEKKPIDGWNKLEFFEMIKNIKWNDFDSTYSAFMTTLTTKFTDINFELVASQENFLSSNYYITKELMEEIVIGNLFLKEWYELENPDSSFFEYEQKLEENDNTQLTFSDLSSLINNWLFDFGINFSYIYNLNLNDWKGGLTSFKKSSSINKIKFTSNLFENNQSLLTDVVFGTKYYNQYTQAVFSTARVYIAPKAFNATNEEYNYYYENDEFSDNSDSINFALSESKDEFYNTFGNISNNNDDVLWNQSFGKYYNEDGSINEEVLNDYVPVIVSTQAKQEIDEMVEDGLIYENNGIYTASIRFDSLVQKTNYDLSPEMNSLPKEKHTYLKFDFKIEKELFVGIDFGMCGFTPFFDEYFDENYEYIPNDLTIDNHETPLFIDDGNLYINDYNNDTNRFEKYNNDYNSSYFEYFHLPFTQKFNVSISNVKPELNVNNPQEIDQKINPTTSLIIGFDDCLKLFNLGTDEVNHFDFSYLSENKNISNDEYPIYLNEVLDSANSIPISVNSLLTQGQIVYKVVIMFFMVIALFAIFISTTIVVIAIKDIIDSALREVSMLKAFGYSNTKATLLIKGPYIIIVFLAFLIALPITFLFLDSLAILFTNLTGNVFTFTLTLIQWIIIFSYIFILNLFLFIVGYISFARTNALDAIKETDG